MVQHAVSRSWSVVSISPGFEVRQGGHCRDFVMKTHGASGVQKEKKKNLVFFGPKTFSYPKIGGNRFFETKKISDF